MADGGERLQEQGRLADARIAADQNHGAGHEPAAEHPVKFVYPRLDAAYFGRVDGMDRRGIFFGAEA